MIMSKTADSLTTAFSPSAKINLVFVEVTDSARELERSHLCGPTAGLIQAEALAAVALLGAELSQPEETVTLRMRVSGPVGGLLVEAGADGSLRGHTQVKVMNDLDACEELDLSCALGEHGEIQIIRSLPGKILASGMTEVSPASVGKGLEQYYQQSLQRHVLVQVSALAYGGFIDGSRGLLAECLPDGDREVFERVAKYFEDGTMQESLEAAASPQTLCSTLGLDDCVFQPAKPLRFACRCTPERVDAMLAGMPSADLEELVREERPTRVFCHMCGKGYEVSVERVRQILSDRG
ncbi:MAG TPA: Hsp33 family molecular chaperone HslO [Kiritimatiellia bacterium]|nr:Hsp33 family molecular chaperone HslO [Kiritimatiellia bacterium]HRU70761.1 Hsp33 family molecular chaperone HslO [Kiritimatiellia bacterium]